ncbi:hypothetical protein Gasu2_34900 [Galdieria sulphuraria]|nr:hypothetical protein Gasu2_34900 [Galdieria sulphuraria]
MKCPTCRRQVEFVDLNFYSENNYLNKKLEENQTTVFPKNSIRIPLQLLLEYRRKEIRRLVASTFQVSFVGSSGIPLLGNSNQVLEKFAYKVSCSDKLEDGEQEKKASEKQIERLDGFLSSYVQNDNFTNCTESLFDLLFDMNEWKKYYSANAFIKGRLIRFGCFAFWEFLRILRSAGAPDGILPDVIVTCVDLCNEINVQETMEMQDIMTKTYKQYGRTLYNIWLDTSESQCEERKSTEHQLEKIFHSMKEAVWPRKVVVLPKLLNPKESSKLGEIIVNECIKSRKSISFYYRNDINMD